MFTILTAWGKKVFSILLVLQQILLLLLPKGMRENMLRGVVRLLDDGCGHAYAALLRDLPEEGEILLFVSLAVPKPGSGACR